VFRLTYGSKIKMLIGIILIALAALVGFLWRYYFEPRFRERWKEDLVASATLALVIVTAIVGIVQLVFLEKADEQAKEAAETARKSADAAKDSADAARASVLIAQQSMVASNRPWITLVGSDPKVALSTFDTSTGKSGIDANLVLKLSYANIGHSPAVSATLHEAYFARITPPRVATFEAFDACDPRKASAKPKEIKDVISSERSLPIIFPGQTLATTMSMNLQTLSSTGIDPKTFIVSVCLEYKMPGDANFHHTRVDYQMFASGTLEKYVARFWSGDDNDAELYTAD
jgi:hypothetical protein